jgi:hypothetical protein
MKFAPHFSVGLIGIDTKVIFAGDPRQLGPKETMEFFNKHNFCKHLSLNKSSLYN